MAVAETAEMAVRLSLDSSRFSQSINRIDRRLGAFSGAVNRNLGRAVDSVVSKGINLAFDAVRSGLDNLAQLETATTQVTGAIKTMGKQGQVSADQIAGWAVEIETAVQSAFDDKDITAASATLIRYGNIATANLKPAMVVMTDLAARTGDVGSASKLLAKALADPTKAAGALRKAGVVLTAAQEKQIKSLAKQGKLTEAQSVLLEILGKRTKGAAAAMNGPAVDAQKELADAWEEATKALATGLLPVITRFNTFLKDKLSDPTVIANIKKIGEGIGKAADQALTFAQSIPWDKVADGLHTAADFAGKLIGVFTSLPPQVQGTIIALAGLNKLSGGAVTGIVGELGKGLIKGVLGMTAGVVNLKAGVVNGGGGIGGGGAGVGGSGTSRLAKGLAAASIVADIVGVVATQQEISAQSSDQAAALKASLDAGIKVKTPAELQTALNGVNEGINSIQANPLFVLVQGDALNQLKAMRSELQTKLGQPQTPEPTVPGQQGARGQHGFGPPPKATVGGPSAAVNHVFLDGVRGNVLSASRDMDKHLSSAAQALSVLKTQGINLQAIAGQRLLALGATERSVKGSIQTLKERLHNVIANEARATRAGDSRHAAQLAAKESAIRGQLSSANAKLAAIRAKKTSVTTNVKVNVNTAVSVSAIQRAARVSSRVARTTQNAYR